MAIQQTVQEPVVSSEVVVETNPSVMSPNSVVSSTDVNSVGAHPKMGGFWERFVATLIDSVLLGLIGAPFYLIIQGNSIATSINNSGNSMPMFTGAQMFLQLMSFALAIGYQVFFLTTKGQTLGKMVMKLKVLDQNDLSKLTVTEVIIRELGKLLSNLALSLGYMWYLIDPQKQTWHDKFSKSLVVKTDDKGEVLMTGNPPYAKNKLAFFGVYGGCCLLWIILFGIIGFAMYSVGKEGIDALREGNMENSVGEYEYNYDMNEDGTESTPQDVELDFEEMLRQYNEQMDNPGTEPVPMEDFDTVN